MKIHAPIILLTSSLALCQNLSPGGSDLLTVLQGDPDTQAFGDLLKEHPDLLENLDSTKNYTVFAPSNAAVAEFKQTFNINGSISRRTRGLQRRSLPDFAAAVALLFTDRSNQGNLNLQSTDLITNLTDPEFINLGPASASASPTQSTASLQSISSLISLSASSVPSTTVSTLSSASSSILPSTSAPVTPSSVQSPKSTVLPIPSPPTPTSSPAEPTPEPKPEGAHAPAGRKKVAKRSISQYLNADRRQLNESSPLQIHSGFGKVTEASLSETLYQNGAVRKADSFLTLFGDLASTLQQTNGTGFASSLAQAGILDSLSKTPKITVFVPSDAVLLGQTLDATVLQKYVLTNTLATSASLKAGIYKTSGGESVQVTTSSDGSFSVNNATIVNGDVMIKNGVVHYIDKVYTATSANSAPGLTFSWTVVVAAVLMVAAQLI